MGKKKNPNAAPRIDTSSTKRSMSSYEKRQDFLAHKMSYHSKWRLLRTIEKEGCYK